MRIDYFLLSKSLSSLVAEVKVFGSGADRQGFLGSDHSPVLLRLKNMQDKVDEPGGARSGGGSAKGE